MDSQNIPRQSRRAQLDKCHLTLGAARDELQALAILFEHFDNSLYGADAIKGASCATPQGCL